ncbi:MAG: 2,3,4,5-tetrahydropyridine-2,6-dicarboxylate N-succinyltransferase, partial [Myxococcota bacterium]
MSGEDELRGLIEAAYEDRDKLEAAKDAVIEVIDRLDQGRLRVASPPAEEGGEWSVHAWVKQAVLLYFGIRGMERMELPPFEFH